MAPSTVGANPSIKNPSFGLCSAWIAGVGYEPYTRIVAVGSCSRMSGQTSWASHPAESTLGGWWKVPMVVNPILGSNPGVVDSFVFTSVTSQKNDAGTILRGGIPNVSRINRVSVGEHTIVKSQRCTDASSRFNLSSPAAGTAAIAASTRST